MLHDVELQAAADGRHHLLDQDLKSVRQQLMQCCDPRRLLLSSRINFKRNCLQIGVGALPAGHGPVTGFIPGPHVLQVGKLASVYSYTCVLAYPGCSRIEYCMELPSCSMHVITPLQLTCECGSSSGIAVCSL